MIARTFAPSNKSFPICMRTLWSGFPPTKRLKPTARVHSSSTPFFVLPVSACLRQASVPRSRSRSLVSLQPTRGANCSPHSSRLSRSVTTMAPSSSDHASAQNGTYAPPRVHVLSSQVEKPEPDDRAYRLVRLFDNKLEALLVHDPKTEKSSAAMDVHVGHLSDPKDFPGLAHALEHCLFLGTNFQQLSIANFLAQAPRSIRKKTTTKNTSRSTVACQMHSQVRPCFYSKR